MTPNLPKELIAALHASGDDNSLEVLDPSDNRTYIIVDTETHRRAMQALRQQDDWNSLQRGVAEADAGQGMSLNEADQKIRAERGFPTDS